MRHDAVIDGERAATRSLVLEGCGELLRKLSERVMVNDGTYGADCRDLKLEGRNPNVRRFAWRGVALGGRSLGGTAVCGTSTDDLPRMEQVLITREHPVLVDIVIGRNDV